MCSMKCTGAGAGAGAGVCVGAVCRVQCHCCLAAFLHIGFCNSIRQVYSEIDSMIGYLSWLASIGKV